MKYTGEQRRYYEQPHDPFQPDYYKFVRPSVGVGGHPGEAKLAQTSARLRHAQRGSLRSQTWLATLATRLATLAWELATLARKLATLARELATLAEPTDDGHPWACKFFNPVPRVCISGLQKLHAGGYEHIFRLSERSEPLQAGVSSARVARLKFQPFFA